MRGSTVVDTPRVRMPSGLFACWHTTGKTLAFSSSWRITHDPNNHVGEK